MTRLKRNNDSYQRNAIKNVSPGETGRKDIV